MYLAFLNILINGKFHKGVQAGGSLCELKTKQISEAVHEYFIFWGKNAFRHCVKNTSGTMRNISYQLCWWEEWLTIIYNIFGTTWLLISQLLLELVSVINQQQADVGSLTTSSLLPSRLGRLCIPLPNKLQTRHATWDVYNRCSHWQKKKKNEKQTIYNYWRGMWMLLMVPLILTTFPGWKKNAKVEVSTTNFHLTRHFLQRLSLL